MRAPPVPPPAVPRSRHPLTSFIALQHPCLGIYCYGFRQKIPPGPPNLLSPGPQIARVLGYFYIYFTNTIPPPSPSLPPSPPFPLLPPQYHQSRFLYFINTLVIRPRASLFCGFQRNSLSGPSTPSSRIDELIGNVKS